jgi:hypothetical protein
MSFIAWKKLLVRSDFTSSLFILGSLSPAAFRKFFGLSFTNRPKLFLILTAPFLLIVVFNIQEIPLPIPE